MQWLTVTKLHKDNSMPVKIPGLAIVAVDKILSIDNWNEDGIGCRIYMVDEYTIDVEDSYDDLEEVLMKRG